MAADLRLTTPDRHTPGACGIRLQSTPVRAHELWTELLDAGLQQRLEAALLAIREAAPDAWRERGGEFLVEDLDVSALGGVLARRAVDAIEGGAREGRAFECLLSARTDHESVLGEVGGSLEDVVEATVDLLRVGGECPAIEVVLDSSHMEATPEARRRLLALLVALKRGCDVRVVSRGVIARLLVKRHGDLLPASTVNAAAPPYRRGTPSHNIHETAAQATESMGLDHSDWRVLHVVAGEPGERISLHALNADARLTRSRSALSHAVTRLADLGLVERLDVDDTRYVRLLRAGDVARRLRADAGKLDSTTVNHSPTYSGRNWTNGGDGNPPETGQSSISCDSGDNFGGGVNDPPNPPAGAVLSPREGERGETGSRPDRREQVAPRTPREQWLPADRHHAVAAAAGEADLAVVDGPPPLLDHPGDRGVSVNRGRREVVVEVEVDGAARMAVTGVRLAAALASDRVLRTVLDPDRASGLLEELDAADKVILRKGLCVGWLPEEIEDLQELRRRLELARQGLLARTVDLTTADGEFREDVASEVLRTAHGLAGTVTHLLDVLGFDVHRSVVLPEYSRNFATPAVTSALAEFIATQSYVSSRYGHYTGYRSLIEERPEKLEDALTGPAVNPESPVGELLGTWVISGNRAAHHGLPEALRGIGERRKVREGVLEEGREWFVDLEVVQGMRREAVRGVLGRLGSMKQLIPTPAVTSMFAAACSTPYDVARAFHELGGEDVERRLQLDEVRSALATLPADRLFPTAQRAEGHGLGPVVRALLGAEGWLSTAELARRSGTTPATVRGHREALEAAGLVLVESGEPGEATRWRFRLPARSERGDEEAPTPRYLVGEDAPTDGAGADRDWRLHEAVEEVAIERGEGLVVETWALWERLREYGRGGVAATMDVREWLRGWADPLAALVGDELGDRRLDRWADGPARRRGQLGIEPSDRSYQARLDRFAEETGGLGAAASAD